MTLSLTEQKSIHTTIERIGKVWMRRCPQEYQAIMRLADQVRASLRYNNAMSAEGCMMLKNLLTEELDVVMKHVFGSNWKNDPYVMPQFLDVFKGLVINHTSVLKLGEGPNILDGYQLEENKDSADAEIVNQLHTTRHGSQSSTLFVGGHDRKEQ